MPQTNFTPGKTFVAGLVAGFFILCTLGFFIMLGLYLTGDKDSSVKVDKTSSVTAGDYPEQFSQCLDSGKYTDTVKSDLQLGASLGVQGTPATFINGYLISGALPFANVAQVIDALIAGQEPDFDFLRDRDTGEIVKVDMPELPNVIWEGNENSNISIVEFSDFECPYCERFAPTVHQILDTYGDKIRFTPRHFPLSFHTSAQKAGEAYECAKEQGKAFEMYDKLFGLSGAGSLSVDNFKKAAGELGLE